MKYLGCHNCKYQTDNCCAVNPVHHAAWKENKYQSQTVYDAIQVNGVGLNECPHFDLEIKQEKTGFEVDFFADKSLIYYATKNLVIFVVAGAIAYYSTANSEVLGYKDNPHRPVYILSEEAKTAVPECRTIFNSVVEETSSIERSKGLNQLSDCLEKIPIDTKLLNSTKQLERDYRALAQFPDNLHVTAVEGEYSRVIKTLDLYLKGMNTFYVFSFFWLGWSIKYLLISTILRKVWDMVENILG